jgi:ssDNA-binding Zn-finger/Zn-ribbon topoisomerase 1
MIFDKEGSDLKCPACGCGAKLINSKEIYGTGYGLMWVCQNFPDCDYRVSCKKGTATPTGELANEQLREFRKAIINKIDHLQGFGHSQEEIWEDLRYKFNKNPFKISESSDEECKEILEFLNKNY